VQRNIGEASAADTIASTAISRFGSIDVVVDRVGNLFTKPFPGHPGTRSPVVLGKQSVRIDLHHATGFEADGADEVV
jgi:hypothetical protein